MPDPAPSLLGNASSLQVFETELVAALPFREDTALLITLLGDVPPVLSALGSAYRASAEACAASRAGLSEGFALFNLLCRRAGLLGATPTAGLALARALVAALNSEGVSLAQACVHDLSVVAVEGYSAGRDELREHSLRTIALESQVALALAPSCFLVCLAGSLLSEPLERLLDERARKLFRAEARSVLLDISRLQESGEDHARAIVAFAGTLAAFGVEVLVYDAAARFDPWFNQLGLTGRGAQHSAVFTDCLTRALAAAGCELKTRGRLGDLLDKVRTSAR
jgi:hypothetical protein